MCYVKHYFPTKWIQKSPLTTFHMLSQGRSHQGSHLKHNAKNVQLYLTYVQCSRLRAVRSYITFYAVIRWLLGVNTRRTKGNVSRRTNITMVLFYLALPSYEWQWWGVTRVGHSCSILIRPGGA